MENKTDDSVGVDVDVAPEATKTSEDASSKEDSVASSELGIVGQSSIKSEGKFDISLIKTILGEMKSEFNRDIDSVNVSKSVDSEVGLQKKKETRSSLSSDKKLKEDAGKPTSVSDSTRVVRSHRTSESSPLKINPKSVGVVKNISLLKDETKDTSKDRLMDISKIVPQDVSKDRPIQFLKIVPLKDIMKPECISADLSTMVPSDTPKDGIAEVKVVKATPIPPKNAVKIEVNDISHDMSKDMGVAKDGPVLLSVSKDASLGVPKMVSTNEPKEMLSQEGSGMTTTALNQESKPRIVITLKTTDDTSDGTKKVKSKGGHAEGGNDEVWTVKVEPRMGFSSQTSGGKRSLRSQTAAKSSEPEGVKRSARRRSKDLPRESVLQSAIARKEKSFSLGQSDEKPGRSPKLRSPLSSPIDKSLKSPDSRRSLMKTTKADVNNMSINFELLKVDTGSSAESPVKSYVKVKQEFDSKIARDPSIMLAIKSAPSSSSQALAYTKTGKRRYKPYKGLRYSLTSGNITRRSKVVPRTRSDELPDTSSSFESQLAEVPCTSKDTIGLDACLRTDSPLIDEACQDLQLNQPTLKRKILPDVDYSGGDESKRGRQDIVPSPSPGDSSQVPAKPESTAISSGAGTAGLCLCQNRSQLFVSTKSGTAVGDIYCQAVDSLDDRLVGCCNSIVTPEVRMMRPSGKVPYLILCEVHTQRLLRHNCCPGCGVFCTQGKFVRCSSRHYYHRECQLLGDVCPHCGVDSPDEDSMLFFKAQSNPVFVPQQKSPKKLPSAKMGFTGCGAVSEPTPEKPDCADASVRLPCGRDASAEGLSPTLDREKLECLLNVANSVPPNPVVRYTIKSLIQASKTGNAERLINALASGLSPNTIFRDQGHSCLHLASVSGSIATVHVLVQAGAELDTMDRDQNTPLMLATLTGNNAVVKYLVKAGASVTLRGSDGQTALHLAAKSGNLEACHYLLSVANVSRSYINSEDDGGWTPLVWAAEHCHTPIAKFLLERRADPLVRDAEQNVALHWAAFSGSVDISEMLLNYGCEVNSINVHGDSPLHIGARQNMYHCVLLLLMRGATVALKNKAGDSPVECCSVKPSDCHTVISINLQLQAITNHPARRLLTNDISRGKEINPVQCVNNEDSEGEPTDFIYVSENCYTSNIVVDRTITSLQSCRCTDRCTSTNCLCSNISLKCWYDSEGRLLPDFNFADPPMLFECNQGCACNRITCHNRVVQHGLTCRFQLFRTCEKGWGVRSLRLIPKGSYVCEYIGEIISDCEADHREDDSYLFDLDNRDGETFCIDARHYGNVARFINHMCVPNLIPVRVFIDHQDLHFPRIAFFANRDIQPDEELGFDYGEKFWIIKCKSFTCTCGAELCRYSDATIQQTLDTYNKRMLLEESLQP